MIFTSGEIFSDRAISPDFPLLKNRGEGAGWKIGKRKRGGEIEKEREADRIEGRERVTDTRTCVCACLCVRSGGKESERRTQTCSWVSKAGKEGVGGDGSMK